MLSNDGGRRHRRCKRGGMALLPAALCSDSAFAGVLRPVLTEFRLKESTLYLLYRSRKYLPFKARKFIDLVLESGAGSGEQPHTSATASVLQYPQRTVEVEVLQERDERALPSVDPYRTQRGELGVVRPAVGGAH